MNPQEPPGERPMARPHQNGFTVQLELPAVEAMAQPHHNRNPVQLEPPEEVRPMVQLHQNGITVQPEPPEGPGDMTGNDQNGIRVEQQDGVTEELRIDIFDRLSTPQIDNILGRIMRRDTQLQVDPILLNLCFVSRRWRHYVLSCTQHCLLYFNMDHVLVFNARWKAWLWFSLDFCNLGGRKVLNFVATDGGQLCLITECGEFFACNPLIRRYRRLPSPPEHAVSNLDLRSVLQTGRQHLRRDFVVEMFSGAQSTGHFKLLLVILKYNSLRTIMYNSRENSWRQVDLDWDGHGPSFFFAWPRAKCRGKLYLGGLDAQWPGNDPTCRLFQYDSEEERWRHVCTSNHDSIDLPRALVARHGTMYMQGANARNRVQFYEVQETRSALTLVPTESLFSSLYLPDTAMSRVLRDMWRDFDFVLVAGENTLYNVNVFRYLQSRSVIADVEMFDWENPSSSVPDWLELGLQDDRFPVEENFHIFRPTLKFYN